MTLCDTGPLIALLDRKQARHADCRRALPSLSVPLVTTWPCFAEAMYLLGRNLGYPAQDALWQYIADELLAIHWQSEQEGLRMRALMAAYRDAPMDLADASVVVAAETLGLRQVFTLDCHFYAYRLADGAAFEVVP